MTAMTRRKVCLALPGFALLAGCGGSDTKKLQEQMKTLEDNLRRRRLLDGGDDTPIVVVGGSLDIYWGLDGGWNVDGSTGVWTYTPTVSSGSTPGKRLVTILFNYTTGVNDDLMTQTFGSMPNGGWQIVFDLKKRGTLTFQTDAQGRNLQLITGASGSATAVPLANYLAIGKNSIKHPQHKVTVQSATINVPSGGNPTTSYSGNNNDLNMTLTFAA